MNIDKLMISTLVSKQLKNNFDTEVELSSYQDITLNRIEKCFGYCQNKYYFDKQEIVFSPYHSVQYSIYLYFLANSIYKEKGRNDVSNQLYYLNKIMNSVDWYYEISLPDVFCAEHPIGSVMGRAKYSNCFFFYQGCTVGGNKGVYPSIGKNVTMYANSTLIGSSIIGDNVIISTDTTIKDENIPSNSIVFGQSPNLIIKKKHQSEIKDLTKQFWKRN